MTKQIGTPITKKTSDKTKINGVLKKLKEKYDAMEDAFYLWVSYRTALTFKN